MDKKRDLILITTKPEFLHGDKGNEKILFSEGRTEKHKLPAGDPLEKFNQNRFKPNELFQLKDEKTQVFATTCLYKNVYELEDAEHKLLKNKAESGFLPSLLETALSKLSEAERQAIQRVFFIVHAADLGEEESKDFERFKKENIFKELKGFEGKTLKEGDFNKNYPDNEAGVFICGFSHVPNSHSIYDALSNYDSIFKDVPFTCGELLVRLVGYECGEIPEIEWMKNWSGTPLALMQKFNFVPHFIDKDGDVVEIKNQKGHWFNKAAEFFKKNSTAKQVRVVKNGLSKEIPTQKRDRTVNIVFLSLTQIWANKKKLNDVLAGDGGVFTHFKLNEKDGDKYPTLFVGYKNILDDEQIVVKEGIRLDRRYRFLDSSIWFRYAALDDLSDDFGTLQSALAAFDWAFEHWLYDKNVCKEYAEFNQRLFQNSYLKHFGDGHSLSVFPFVFHSEWKMEKNASDREQSFKEKKLDWNFLLIDDYAELELREGDNLPIEGSTEHQKGQLVEDLINVAPGKSHDPKKHSLVKQFKLAISVDEAKKNFLEKKDTANAANNPSAAIPQTMLPDIILLDYLFSYPRERQHFGTQLLKAIADKEVIENRSVAQKYWIHPISVFNEAMLSEMLEKSYQHFEPDWFLARGADPVNTPYLFRCSLFEFLDVQSELLIFDRKELWDFLINQNFEEKTSSNASQQHPNNPNFGINQDKTLHAFRNFLEQFSADEGDNKRSAINTSAKAYMNQSTETDALELRDHLRRILYLFSYTAGFDFPAIEREFRQIDRIYRAYKHDPDAQKAFKDTDEKLKDYPKNWEDHLKKLDKAILTLANWVYNFAPKYQ